VLNLDPTKLLIIAVVAVILLGPDKLPQVARQVGAAWRSCNEFRHRMEREVRSSIPDLPSSAEIARLARSPSALLNHLSTLSPDKADENGNGVAGNGVAGNGVAEGAGSNEVANRPASKGLETSADPSGVESHGEQSATTSMPPTRSAPTSPTSPSASSASPNTPPPAPGVFGDPSLN
jgi:TatA/E family protein of Tat protein translocase